MDAFFWAHRQSPAALAQLVQAAMPGTEAGLATRAAAPIGGCLAREAGEERLRAGLVANPLGLSRAMLLDMQADLESALRMCQTLDGFSRAQWLPLLHRGLAEGRIGDAYGLLMAVLGSPYERPLRPDAYPSLRNDAFRCHEGSLSRPTTFNGRLNRRST